MANLYVCPSCGNPLIATADGFECSADEESFPRLGPLLVLTPHADEVLSRHRDPFLAALAESGEVTATALARVEAAHRQHRAEPESLRDDLTGSEDGVVERRGPASPASALVEQLLAMGRDEGPLAAIRERLPASIPRAAEIGPGAGLLTAALAERTDVLVLLDRVPRTLLRARRAATRGGHPAPELVVSLAEALPLAPGTFDLVVAMNVVDLLDDPAGFLQLALEALTPEGRLLVSTPDPGLGSDDPATLAGLIEALDGRVHETVDGLPWLRQVSGRHTQLFLTQLVAAGRR